MNHPTAEASQQFYADYPQWHLYTQQDYYDPQYGTLLHSYCTST